MRMSKSRDRRSSRLTGIVSPRLGSAAMLAGAALGALAASSADAQKTLYLRVLEESTPPTDWEYTRAVGSTGGINYYYNWSYNPNGDASQRK